MRRYFAMRWRNGRVDFSRPPANWQFLEKPLPPRFRKVSYTRCGRTLCSRSSAAKGRRDVFIKRKQRVRLRAANYTEQAHATGTFRRKKEASIAQAVPAPVQRPGGRG